MNDQGAFDAGNNSIVAPVAGTYLFGASLLFKINASTSTRMRGRLVLNAATEIKGSFGEISGAHVSEATALWLQTLAPLAQGDTIEFQGTFRAQDGYFATGQGWYLRSAGIWSYNFETGAWSIPIGLGAGKVIKTDRAVVNAFLEPQYSVATHGDGQPEWNVFGGVNFQF